MTSRKNVNVIIRGNPFSDYSVREFKGYERHVNSIKTKPEEDAILEFDEQKMANLVWPHNNALVIEIMLVDCKITRSLVDTGSSVNVIYKDIFDQMELADP